MRLGYNGLMELKPARFISEPIEVTFRKPPQLEKTPTCPDGFIWRDELFEIDELVAEWHDYERRGRMDRNMRPTHALTAARRGSWGVGQFYFRVLTANGRFFELYYDRAPKDVDNRRGGWFLYRELTR